MHTCAKLLGGFLLPLWKRAGSTPYNFWCTFSSDQTAGVCLEGDPSWRAGSRYRAWWVGTWYNIVLSGQPQFGDGHMPLTKVLHQMGTLKSGSGKSKSGKCGTIWQVGPGRSAISAICYSESSDWTVGTETICLLVCDQRGDFELLL